jgi:hypothetical protein
MLASTARPGKGTARSGRPVPHLASSEEMMARAFGSFAEFEREYLRPARAVGQTVEDMIEDSPFEVHFDFDRDPYEDSDDDDDDY